MPDTLAMLGILLLQGLVEDSWYLACCILMTRDRSLFTRYDLALLIETRLSHYNVTTRLVDLVGLCWFKQNLVEKIC